MASLLRNGEELIVREWMLRRGFAPSHRSAIGSRCYSLCLLLAVVMAAGATCEVDSPSDLARSAPTMREREAVEEPEVPMACCYPDGSCQVPQTRRKLLFRMNFLLHVL